MSLRAKPIRIDPLDLLIKPKKAGALHKSKLKKPKQFRGKSKKRSRERSKKRSHKASEKKSKTYQMPELKRKTMPNYNSNGRVSSEHAMQQRLSPFFGQEANNGSTNILDRQVMIDLKQMKKATQDKPILNQLVEENLLVRV